MMKRSLPSVVAVALLSLAAAGALAQGNPAAPGALPDKALDGLALRSIGPAITPGRIADIAVDPKNDSTWYIAVGSGGLWKTTNRGVTFTPIFDNHGSYSTGCVAVDPNNSNVVWLGTGENQASRSMSFGDGLYKSTDAGQSWKKVGLATSEHLAKIVIDPRNTDTVYVASQGPLWAPGGDRGLFKTTDGGQTWKPILQVSENTGVTDVLMDPRNPDVLYAASWQRRRNVGVLIGGGPESAIYKSIDGGATWNKLTNGLPTADRGRIALALSPQRPDVVYALVIAGENQTGFFRSEDGGENWARMSNQGLVDPQYYGEIIPDPHVFDHLYMVDMTFQESLDGGKTWRATFTNTHVDHHAFWVDPKDKNHLLLGNDGGLYESYDAGRTFRHFTNMPTMQFYHIGLDQALPFYNVAAGSQDNGSTAGPSRTPFRVGVRNGDWISIGGGDGMQPRIDPTDPDTVYSMSQNGAIQRLDKKTSAARSIRPNDPAAAGRGRGRGGDAEREEMEAEGMQENTEVAEAAPAAEGAPPGPPTVLRWNWNAPFVLSSHNPQRLYLAANRLFRSDNRGDAWQPISPDLTRQLDRNKIEVMGKLWPENAVARHTFTTDLSIITALAESPLNERILAAGTDDGLVQVTEDGGGTWRKIESFPGLPAQSYIVNLFASQHDANTLYAAANNWQRGDFKPYLIKSTDLGRTWTTIAGNLPDRNPVWCVTEDPVNRNLLFAGTEFGLYVSINAGAHWTQLKGGVPTIAFRDVQIHKRESDLVGGTFGRGVYILDDISPLRAMTPASFEADATLFPMRRAMQVPELSYVRASPGEFTTPNPPPGAIITYHLKNALGPAVATAPATPPAATAAEGDDDTPPVTRGGRGGRGNRGGSTATGVILSIADASGAVVRRIDVPATAGLHRVSWDLRGAAGSATAPTQQPPTQTQPGQPVQAVGTRPGVAGQILTEPAQAIQPGGPTTATADAPARGRGGRGGGGGAAALPFVRPGTYTVTLARSSGGTTTPLAPPQTVEVTAPAPSGR